MKTFTREEVEEKLAGHPEDSIEAFMVFQERRDQDSLEQMIQSILVFFSAESGGVTGGQLEGSMHLRDDLSLDSVTIAELVFILEDLLHLRVENEALMRIETVDDLRNFLLSRLEISARS